MKEIARKVTMSIEKEQAKLDSLISKRDALTADYQAKLADFNENIKKSEKTLASLREQEKIEKLDAVAFLISKNGITVDDLLKAVANNDLYSIQEILENGGKNKADTSAAETDNDTDSKEDSEKETETSDTGTYGSSIS